MGYYDPTTLGYALKRRYSDRRMAMAGFNPKNSFFTMMKKNTDFTGESLGIPIQAGGPSGESHTFTSAQTNKTGPSGKQFLVTVGEDYVIATVTGKLVATTRNNQGAFLKGVEAAVDAALKRANRRIAIEAYLDGSGLRGIAGTVSVNTIPLTVATQIVRFSPGQTIHGYTSGGTDHGTAVITNIDYNAATITVGAIGSIVTGDYLYLDGDKALCRSGWLGWNPLTAPTSGDSFFSVDRSSYPTIYSGHRLTSDKTLIAEKIYDLIGQASDYGCETDSVFINTRDFSDFALQVESKVTYVESARKGFGSEAIQIFASSGKVNVFPDIDAPKGYAFGCKLDVWEHLSAGASPSFLNFDGLGQFVRESSTDGYEIRIGGYDQIACYDTTQIWHSGSLA